MKGPVFLDSFSGAASDLPKGRRTPEDVLAVLSQSPLVSIWDMSEHTWLRNSIADLKERGLIEAVEAPHPWIRYRVIEARKSVEGE